MNALAKLKPEDGYLYVTEEQFRDYVFDPYKEELQIRSGMSQEQIDNQRQEMMAGRIPVRFRNLIVKVREG